MPAADQNPRVSTGIVIILLTLAGWSSIPLFLKHFADRQLDPWTTNGWRYGMSALIWLPVIFWGLARKNLPKGVWKAALVPSIFNTAAQICFAIAPYMVDPGLMTFSMRLQIVFLTIGAAVMFAAERAVIRSPGFLAGMAMVLLGTAGTLWLKPGGLGGGTAGGVALAIGAGLLYAAYALGVRKWMHGMPSLPAFAVVSQYTGAVILVFMWFLGERHGAPALDLPGREFFYLVLSAVIGIGLGHTLYYASIARLGLAVSAGVVQLQPIAVSIGSFFLFGEKLTQGQWAFGVVAVVGAGVMLWAQHKTAARARLAAKDEEKTEELLCAQCGFSLEGLSADRCPECGNEMRKAS